MQHTGGGVAARAAYHERRARERDEDEARLREPEEIGARIEVDASSIVVDEDSERYTKAAPRPSKGRSGWRQRRRVCGGHRDARRI